MITIKGFKRKSKKTKKLKKKNTQPAWMHLRCISETSHTASQRHLKEG